MTTPNALFKFRRPALFALLAAALLVFSGCGTTTTDATAGSDADASGPVNASSFVGTWTLPEGSSCDSDTTAYTFADDGAYTEIVGSESFSGTWTFENENLETVLNVNGGQVEDTWDWEFSEDRSELTLFAVPNGAVCTYAKEDS